MLTTYLIMLLLSNAATRNRDESILFSRVTIINLLDTSLLAWGSLYPSALAKGIGIFGGLFHVTTFTHTFSIFILLLSAIILSLNAFYPRKLYSNKQSSFFDLILSTIKYNKYKVSNKAAETYRIIEYPLIITFIICGALFLISSNDLVSMFLSIELQSYGLYILSTLYKDSESATASGLTYFLLGGLSSCFILLGSALLYVNTGTTNLENIYVIAELSEITMELTLYNPNYIHLSLIILFVGFLFKISAAPFHFWSPDVYDGVPTVVTTFVAIIPKISILGFFLELVYYSEHAIFGFTWKNILLLSSFLSLIIGSVLGLTQSRLKRLYAYSTINHVGFILLALSITSPESIQSYIFYILQYSLSNLNGFFILIAMGYSLYTYVYNNKLDESAKESELGSGNKEKDIKDNKENLYMYTLNEKTNEEKDIKDNKQMSYEEKDIFIKDNKQMSYEEMFQTSDVKQKPISTVDYFNMLTGNQTSDQTSDEKSKGRNNSIIKNQAEGDLDLDNKSKLTNQSNDQKLIDSNNSPIQLINQIRGYFTINPFIAISLAITLFSFAGVPPMIGFFGKQMILSAALDSGYIFMALIGILTSVISAAYYLNIIKEIFFFKSEYSFNHLISQVKHYTKTYLPLKNMINKSSLLLTITSFVTDRYSPYQHNWWLDEKEKISIILNSCLTTIISILTLLLAFFIYTPEIWFNMVNILTLILFKS